VRPRRFLTTALLVFFCAGFALAGSLIALRAAAPTVRSFTLGTVAFRVDPAREGSLDIYVPIVDWGVRASPFRAPLAVQLEFRAVDRQAALASLRSSGTADANLALLKAELREVVEAGLLRAGGVALLGGAAGGLVAGALLVSIGHRRRRWLLLGTTSGLATSLAVVALAGLAMSRFDYDAFQEPTFYAHGAELPKLLSFSEQLLTAGEEYTDSYDQAVSGLTNLIAFASEGRRPSAIARSAIVASDLHSNGYVLPSFADYTAGDTIFLVGDFTQLGTRYEDGMAARLGRLDGRVVAVSGNHDSRSFMRALAAAGALVLTRDGRLGGDGSVDGRPVVELDGLAVAGYDDPLESHAGTLVDRRLELKERLPGAQDQLLDWFAGLPERPDVVLVHQHGLAHALLEALAAEEDGEPVVILTGHDHRQHVDQTGAHVLVDGGTLGAGGPFGIGEQAAGFAQVHWSRDGRLQAVDLIGVEPLSGAASARRIVLPEPAAVGEATGPPR
jgi:predicted phosphodiesterase